MMHIYFFLFMLDNSDMIKLLKPIAHCYGVINAINLAKRIANEHRSKNIYVFGLLVHNDEVTKDLLDLGIKTLDLTNKDPIEELNRFNKDDIVIFTAHGHPDIYEKMLKDRGITYYDATCPKVKECFNIIRTAKETIYIGKKNHPEANAALTMNDNVHFYDIHEKFDYSGLTTDNPLIINQTTLSFLELKDIHQEIREHVKNPNIVDEICDATLLRQKAINELGDDIDTIFIVGSKKSSNTMKLYEVAKSKHPNKRVYLLENIEDVKRLDAIFNNAVIASGTSTPLSTINQIKEYLERKLIDMANQINHVALIMDGNGRWAKKRGLPRTKGHEEGCKRIIEIFDAVKANHIYCMTLYAFSTENWNRPKSEITLLFQYLDKFFKDNIADLMRDGVRVQVMGDITRLPKHSQKTVTKAIEQTKDNNNYVFNIALNYGSRQELVKATKEIAELVKDNKLDINDINEQTISDHLYTYNLPPIDLMIRTSGEQRLSNYLLYQLAYSEFIFTPTYWPDFTKDKFEECLKEYQTRDRRYGKIEE